MDERRGKKTPVKRVKSVYGKVRAKIATYARNWMREIGFQPLVVELLAMLCGTENEVKVH